MKKRTWVWIVIAAGVVCLVVLSCCCLSGVLGSLGSTSPARAFEAPAVAERADELDAQPTSGGPSPRQRGLALALYTTLFENPDEDEARVMRRVARRQRVSVSELEAAYMAVVSEPEANQQMIRAYNATHATHELSPRGDRYR